ncbi:MAG: hypothetical protein PHS49_06975 [Candidatus Gracilibacteria bacterium]|nr:hypothetical protein [Candidatus Gracilibacteria bacterium]
MNIKRILRESIVSITIISIFGVSYAALSSLTATTGESLTVEKWNSLVESAVPTGAVMAFNGTSCPTGWNKANGSGIEKDTLGNNTTLDLRGEFIRGWDDGKGVDAGRGLAIPQTDTFQGHKHDIYSDSGGNNDAVAFSDSNNTFRYMADTNTSTTRGDSYIYVGNAITNGINGAPRTASETRPRNIALLYCIKN